MRLLTRAPTMVLAAVAALAAISPVHTARATGNIIVGTTDTVNTLDPAKCYNYYCSNILHNVAQTLVTYPPDSTELTPDLAKAMPKVSDDGLTYTFELKQGVTFQDGSALTSEDVKFSLNRSLWMNHPEGAGFLLSGIESIDTPDDHSVVIHLKSPDITFVSKLAYVEATILPSDVYTSPDSPIPNDARRATYEQYVNEDLIGSGPYRIANFRENQSLLLETWDGYAGEAPRNDKVLVRFFSKSSQMLVAMKSGEIDVAFRHFTPEQRESLNQADDIQTIEGEGASIRYLVFNPNLAPAGNKKVRQAVAAALDRQRIIDNALGGAAEPLYSLVPPAFADASPAFDKLYGAKKAADYLDEKVELTLWYSRGHYGDTEPSLAQTIARTLEETGLFDVELQSSEWAQFTASAYPGSSGQYAAFLMGWYPDYLDPDNYLAPFYHSTESFLRVYDNPRMDELLDFQRTADAPDAAPRSEAFAKIQQLAAEDAPIVPLYVITPFAFAREGISGVEEIMGAAQIFRYDRLSKSGG
jgi:peptide/nickel transport system substrate-binding protein